MKLYRCVYQMGVETALEYRAKYGADIVEYDFSNHHSDLFVELSVRQRGCGSDDGL